jgi:hypothetical protein
MRRSRRSGSRGTRGLASCAKSSHRIASVRRTAHSICQPCFAFTRLRFASPNSASRFHGRSFHKPITFCACARCSAWLSGSCSSQGTRKCSWGDPSASTDEAHASWTFAAISSTVGCTPGPPAPVKSDGRSEEPLETDPDCCSRPRTATRSADEDGFSSPDRLDPTSSRHPCRRTTTRREALRQLSQRIPPVPPVEIIRRELCACRDWTAPRTPPTYVAHCRSGRRLLFFS